MNILEDKLQQYGAVMGLLSAQYLTEHSFEIFGQYFTKHLMKQWDCHEKSERRRNDLYRKQPGTSSSVGNNEHGG